MSDPGEFAHQISYSDLYARWERSNWRASELDFSVDREHWRERLTATQRRAALWNYALFLHGEDAVAENLSPYIDAAPREEQKYFLATQQVDEARHAVFFARFISEVVEGTGGDVGTTLERTRPHLTWGFRKLFELLDETAADLRRDRSRPKLAAAITLYHLVVEGTIAQTGQHFIDAYLERGKLMPGFQQGMANVATDEQRHIAFGVRMLADLVAEDPECRYAVADMLRDSLRYAVAVFIPPGWDLSYVESFGATLEDLYEQALASLQTKLRSAGMPIDELPGALALGVGISPREQARRAIVLARAGVVGEKNGRPASDPEIMGILFDGLRQAVDLRRTPARPVTIQWDFSDAEPWHVRIANGSTSAAAERVDDPDLVFECRWEDWLDVAVGREDPRLAILKRKLRPHGSMRLLLRMPSMLRV